MIVLLTVIGVVVGFSGSGQSKSYQDGYRAGADGVSLQVLRGGGDTDARDGCTGEQAELMSLTPGDDPDQWLQGCIAGYQYSVASGDSGDSGNSGNTGAFGNS